MPRRPRIIVPKVPLHIIQRGNNRQNCFLEEEDYNRYVEWLTEYSQDSDCSIHAFVLMSNHIHLLLTPKTEEGPGLLMKRVGQRYVQYLNRKYLRTGTLWEGRFRSCIIEKKQYLFQCQRYIELNPVRARIVKHPSEYPWSSYRVNGDGERSKLITPHPMYRSLARKKPERLQTYRELFGSELDEEVLTDIRKATNGNFAIGNERFIKRVTDALGRRIVPGSPGRPRKES